MRILTCIGALAVALGSVSADDLKGGSGTASPARLKGMKAAVADIEKGTLRRREFLLPDPAWFGTYTALLKTECGVVWETVDPENYKNGRAELDGYNDVMRAEVEHRHGKGVLDRLRKQAQDDWERRRQVEGIHGLLIGVPTTRYYRVMTRSDRMPWLVGEVI